MLLSLSLNADEARLAEQNGDDDKVEITVGEMRQAVWFYENYFVQKELAETRKEIISELVVAGKDLSDALKEVEKDLIATQLFTKIVAVAVVITVTIGVGIVAGEVRAWVQGN